MFDFAWSEIALIGAVALIAIGPKDMPAAIRTVSSMIKKARRMAAEFQTHVDEMVREAELGDVKKAFTDIRNLDLSSVIEKHVDPDRSIRNTFTENPLEPVYPAAAPVSTLEEIKVEAQPAVEVQTDPAARTARDESAGAGPDAASDAATASQQHEPLAPAFIPPGLVPPSAPAVEPPPEAPAFIPPEFAQRRQPRA